MDAGEVCSDNILELRLVAQGIQNLTPYDNSWERSDAEASHQAKP